jgi:hypothetical protein
MPPSRLAHRKPGTATILSVRPLTEADLSHLRERAVQQPFQKLKDSHHRVARLLASGLYKDYEVAQMTGFSLAMIGLLKRDPANIELQAHYRALAFNEESDFLARETAAYQARAVKAGRRIDDILDDEDLPLPLSNLLAIQADAHDRVGLSRKQTKDLNVNIGMADRLEAAMARARKVTAE